MGMSFMNSPSMLSTLLGRAISSIGVSAVTVMVSWTLESCIWMSTLKVAPART